MAAEDGQYLEELILSQSEGGETFAIDEREYEKLITHTVRRVDKVVTVTVPKDTDEEEEEQPGLIDLKDGTKTATALFRLLNVIVDSMIVQPSEIDEICGMVPESTRNAIEKRDKKGE